MAKKKVIKDSVIKKREGIIWKNIILFAILFAISLVLYYASNDQAFKDVFLVFVFLFGFVGAAFLISFLVYVFLQYFKK